MRAISRRGVIAGAAGLASSAPALYSTGALAENAAIPRRFRSLGRSSAAKTLIHATDLYRPHNDPDDHWDLVTGFALASKGSLDLGGILIDNPLNIAEMPEQYKTMGNVPRSPDVAAVAQLNYLTNMAIPVSTGTLLPFSPGRQITRSSLPVRTAGIELLVDTLQRSREPVSILIGGSCLDVAVAGMKEPQLFAEKCAGIYLNAGVGSPERDEQIRDGHVEWNVSLSPGGYAAIFDIPCPIYWMPCFNAFRKGQDVTVGEYGTFWTMKQGDILPNLPPQVQAYFALALAKASATDWLSDLVDPSSAHDAQEFYKDERSMYGTAGFLHAAGNSVTQAGRVIPFEQAGDDALFEFVPVEVRCSADGITKWRHAAHRSDRYIFRIRDTEVYAKSMLIALISLLADFGSPKLLTVKAENLSASLS